MADKNFCPICGLPMVPYGPGPGEGRGTKGLVCPVEGKTVEQIYVDTQVTTARQYLPYFDAALAHRRQHATLIERERCIEKIQRLRPSDLTAQGDYEIGHAFGLLSAQDAIRGPK